MFTKTENPRKKSRQLNQDVQELWFGGNKSTSKISQELKTLGEKSYGGENNKCSDEEVGFYFMREATHHH